MNNICIIPARGGSKRIPHKNVRPFLGKPIVAYSIENAISSKLFDEIMVSTDDLEIVDVALQYGASVPFLRSEKTANDFATLADVIREVVNEYAQRGRHFDNVCCFLATAPLVTSNLLREAYAKLQSMDGCSTVYPVVQYSYPVQRCLEMDEQGYVSMKWQEFATSRSQDLQPLYHDSGTFYFHKTALWMEGRIKRSAIVMDELHVQDIDTDTDWQLAEMKYRLIHA